MRQECEVGRDLAHGIIYYILRHFWLSFAYSTFGQDLQFDASCT
jgi:hypothetical protein